MNGIDYKKLEYEFGEDWEIFQELLSDYNDLSASYLGKIKESIDNKNLESLVISAHSLKGVIANFYCEELTKIAFALEQCGKSGDLLAAPEYYEKLVIINSNILIDLMTYDKKRV